MADSPKVVRSTEEQGVSTKSKPNPPIFPPKAIVDEFLRPNKRPRLDAPPPMTAAAALAEARHGSKSPSMVTAVANNPGTSANPASEALGALMGVSQTAMSKAYVPSGRSPARDPATTLSQGAAIAAQHMQPQPQTPGLQTASNDHNAQTSPMSTTSFETPDSITAPSGLGTTVTSPQPMETNSHQTLSAGTESVSPDSNKAFTYPAPLLQPSPSDAKRGMSLPGSGLRQNTRSPSSKKHKCPYCSTEFTRHHNLKSHLLTHSQEKPYVCSTCSSRFRRLHDLKRHTKLHTGERPHVCPKCNRKFARGDALARHNKGPGGCAGRRASMGSFAGDDDYDGDEPMEGVMYNEPEAMDDSQEGVARNTPSIRRQAPSGDDTVDDNEHYSRIPSTYPPIQGRPPGGLAGGAYHSRPSYGPSPPADSSGSIGSGPPSLPYPTATSSSSLRPSHNGPQLFPPNPLTESPKPISPGQQHNRIPGMSENRNQSPNMSHFQHPYPRTMSGSGSSSMALPSTAPQLPPPHSLNPPDSRYTLPSQGPTHPPTRPSGPPTHMSGSGPLSSHSNSLSSHGQQSAHGGSGENSNSMFNKEDRILAYVKDLEKKMHSMQEEMAHFKDMEKKMHDEMAHSKDMEKKMHSMQDEIGMLRSQVAALSAAQSVRL